MLKKSDIVPIILTGGHAGTTAYAVVQELRERRNVSWDIFWVGSRKAVEGKNMKINSVSISIEAKKPRLDNCTDKIIDSLSRILNTEKENIGITCTSGEGLTAFGRGEGMQCFVVVSLV